MSVDRPPPNWSWSRESEGALGRANDEPGYFCGHRLAGWMWRVGAGVIDYGLFFVLPYGCLGGTKLAWYVAGALTLANSGFLAAYTSQSLGKKLMGIRMVWIKRGRDMGLYVVAVPVIVGLIRVPLHFLDYACCGLGFLLPIPSNSKCTIADYLCRTFNYRDPRLPRAEYGVVGPTEWM